MKFDFDDPKQTKSYELGDGEFGTEPVFAENPEGDGSIEDDGFVVVQTLAPGEILKEHLFQKISKLVTFMHRNHLS